MAILLDAKQSNAGRETRPDFEHVQYKGHNADVFSRRVSNFGGAMAGRQSTMELLRGVAQRYTTDEKFRREVDNVYGKLKRPMTFDAWPEQARNGYRADAIGVNGGVLFARDLEYIHARVSEEPVAKLSALELFEVSSQVPLGATSHTIRRMASSGRAKLYKRGMKIPSVELAGAEQSFGVVYSVVGLEMNYFDTLSANYAGLQEYERKVRAAKMAIDRHKNQMAWYGVQSMGPTLVPGLLTYPWVFKRDFAYTIDTTAFPSSVADYQSAKNAFLRVINYAIEQSSEMVRYNRMLVSTQIKNWLLQVTHPEQPNLTLEADILRSQEGITSIDSCWEFQGTGPGGVDYMMLWDDVTPDCKPVINISQPFAALPMETRNFEQEQVFWAHFGGIEWRDVRAGVIITAAVTNS